MTARLYATEQNAISPKDDSPTAYAATGDHHLFLLAVNSVIADAIKNGLRRYDVSDAFLQCELAPENCPRHLFF